MEDDCVFEDPEEMPSERDAFRLQFVESVIEKELNFCIRVNKFQPLNYYMWTYRLRLVRDVLIPLSKKSAVFKENLILREIANVQAYIKQNKKD